MNIVTINGGVQRATDENGVEKEINPGESTLLSYQALMALVIAATTGQYRPNEMHAGIVAYQAYWSLLQDTVGGDDRVWSPENGEPGLMFADIPILQRDEQRSDTIVALDTTRDNGDLPFSVSDSYGYRGMTEDALKHAELMAQRVCDAKNTNSCKFCGRSITWQQIVYNTFGHFNVIAHNSDGTEHDRACAERGAPKVTKIED